MRFTADLELPRLAHAQLVLSPYASARLRNVEASAARRLPGVIDVITATDLALRHPTTPDTLLASDRISYAGQPVAVVVAETEAAAADGATLVEVDCEEQAMVIDPISAMGDQAPKVIDEQQAVSEDDASIHGASTANEGEVAEKPNNVSEFSHLKRGDAEAALKAADAVVRATYRIGRAHQGFIEPHVAIARPEPDGGMTIWSPTQGPFVVRDDVAKTLGVAPYRVRVFPMAVGGGFGGKVELLEPLLALVAMRIGRPVRLALSRSHEFLLGCPAPAAEFSLELGARRDGTLVGLRARFHYDGGAKAGWHSGITANFLGGTYRIPNFDVLGYDVSTHKTPVEAYRAPGATQAYFALESALDELALELGLDPIALRLRNVSRQGDPTAGEEAWPRIASTEVLEEAKRHPLYTAPLKDGEAVGVALGSWGGARSPSAAGCRVEPDGTVSIFVGSPDISGTATGFALIAAEAFGVSPDRVRVELADTGSAPQSAAAGGSQVTYSAGGAVYEAAREARRQLLEIATDQLEAAPEDLEIVDGRVVVKGAPTRSVEIVELVKASTDFMAEHKPIHATGRSAVREASPMFTVHIARVRADHETGAFQLTGYAAIQDVGRAINPPEIEGQVHGGSAQALGRALGEQLVHDADGQLRTGTLVDYELPTVDQIPDIDVRLVEVPSAAGPLGAKGVGEPPAVPGTAALANAVSRAFGRRVREAPIDRWSLIRPRT